MFSCCFLNNLHVAEVQQALKYLKIGTCPASQKILAYMKKNVNLHWKSSKVSLALQPEALVNTSGRVDFSRPVQVSLDTKKQACF